MKHRTSAIVTVLIVFAFCISALPASAGTAPKPVYTVGDYWSYSDSSMNVSEAVKIEVKKGSMTVEGHTCYHVMMTLNQEFGGTTTTMEIDQYQRTSDMAMVKTSVETDVMGMKMSTVSTYDPPVSQYKFPMKVGLKWTSTTNIHTEMVSPFGNSTDDSTQSTSYEVLLEEKVTVKAGTFDAFKIKATNQGGNSTYTWYSSKVGSHVKTESDYSTIELTSYKFAKPSSGGGGGGGDGGGDGGGFLSGEILGISMMYFLIIIIVIVVLIAVVAVAASKKGGAPPVPPAQPGAPPAHQPPATTQPQQQTYDQQYQQPPQQQTYDQQYQQPPQQQTYDQQYQQPPQQPPQY